MTCRHKKGDPQCSSYGPVGWVAEAKETIAKYEPSTTPDASNFEIEDVEQVGRHIVLKAKYPNCAKCAYEGNKVMVFLDCNLKDVLKWRTIDPHFRSTTSARSAKTAPSPAARFPGSAEGWKDAIDYASGKGD